MTAELKLKAWEDFEASGLEAHEWKAFWIGYIAAIKRFGGK